MDLLRIVFASLVLLSHAPELTDGNASREILSRITRNGVSFGGLSVDGFFLLSGYLVVQSWLRRPVFSAYLRSRVLRVVPGYLVAAVLSIIVVGWLAPGVPQFFDHLPPQLPVTLLLLQSPQTARVLPGLPYGLVNGSMWTIMYEFQCYLLIALAGICGVFRRRTLWLLFTLAMLVVWTSPYLNLHLSWHHLLLLTGLPGTIFHLLAVYAVGTSFFLYRDRIVFRPAFAAAAFAGLALTLLHPAWVEPAIVLFGGYLLFYFVQLPQPQDTLLARLPDISYGIYLYGWPIESLWIWYHHGSPWITFAVSLVLCALCGMLSWYFVESPMLKLRSGTARAPRLSWKRRLA